MRRLMVLHMARRLMARMTKGVRANLQMMIIISMIMATRMSEAKLLGTPPKVTHPQPVELRVK